MNYYLVDIITPNETETEYLTGVKVIDDESAQRASNILHDKGIETVLITLGSRGVWVSQNNQGTMVPAFKVTIIDTIAAGDTFNGAFITALLEGLPIMKAIKFRMQPPYRCLLVQEHNRQYLGAMK